MLKATKVWKKGKQDGVNGFSDAYLKKLAFFNYLIANKRVKWDELKELFETLKQ